MDLFAQRRRRKVFPEPLKAFVTAEQCAEDRRVCQQDVTGPFTARRHPEKHIELLVSRFRERMRPGHINGLLGQNMHGLRVFCCHRVVRQVHVEVEGWNSAEKAAGIQVARFVQRDKLIGSLDRRGPQTIPVLHRNSEPFHQRTRVLAEALLAGH